MLPGLPPTAITLTRDGANLRRLFFDLKRELGVDEAAVVAGDVGELGGAALRAADVVNRLEGVARAAIPLLFPSPGTPGEGKGGGLKSDRLEPPPQRSPGVP